MSDIFDDIYKRFDRQAEEFDWSIKAERFTIQGTPVCEAWSGAAGHKPMICQFLQTFSFGTKHNCGILAKPLYHHDSESLSDFLNPDPECPLWKQK